MPMARRRRDAEEKEATWLQSTTCGPWHVGRWRMISDNISLGRWWIVVRDAIRLIFTALAE